MARRPTPQAPSDKGREAASDEQARRAVAERDEELDSSTEDQIEERAAAEEPETPAKPEAEPERPNLQYRDDPRAELAKNYRHGDNEPDEEDTGEEPAGGDAAAAAAKAKEEAAKPGEEQPAAAAEKPAGQAAPEKPAAPGSDPVVTIKVYGQELQLPQSEIVRIAQQQIAAGLAQRVQPARQPESPSVPHGVPSQPAVRSEGAEPGHDGSRRDTIDQTRLVEIADKIQAGTPEEAGQALKDLVETLQTARPSEDVQGLIDARLQTAREADANRAVINRALASVGEAFPDVVKDDDLSWMAYRRLMPALADNLRAIGYSDQEIPTNPAQLLEGYAAVSRDPYWGKRVASIEETFKSAAKTVHERYVVRAPDGGGNEPKPDQQPGKVVISREHVAEAKDRLSRQPRSASTRADYTQPQPKSREAARSDAVQKMAKQRGQATAPA